MENQSKKIKQFIKDSAKYAEENGFKLNPDKKVVERIISGLFRNEEKFGRKYCPCRRVTGNEADDSKIICPCFHNKAEVAKYGKCFCGLFVK